MKNGSIIRNLLALFVLGSVVLSLACSPGTNVNTNTGVNTKANLGDLCPAGADFGTKKANLISEINDEIAEKALLNSQNNERFKYDIVEFGVAPNKGLELQVLGLLRGSREKGAPTVEDFLDIIDEYMDKGCIQRVTFLKRTYGPGELTSDGFDWQSCEFPKVYCNDGVCRDGCYENRDSNTANTNISNSNNSNANANTNPGSNSKSNVSKNGH